MLGSAVYNLCVCDYIFQFVPQSKEAIDVISARSGFLIS